MKIWFSVSIWTQRGEYVGYFNMIQKECQIIHLISLRVRHIQPDFKKGFGPLDRGVGHYGYCKLSDWMESG